MEDLKRYTFSVKLSDTDDWTLSEISSINLQIILGKINIFLVACSKVGLFPAFRVLDRQEKKGTDKE